MTEVAQDFKRSLEAALRPSFIALAVVAIFVIIPIGVQTSYDHDINRNISISSSVADTERGIADMESAQRRLFLTGDPRNRDRFETAADKVGTSMAALEKDVSGDSTMQKSVEAARNDSIDWVAQARQTMSDWDPTTGDSRDSVAEDSVRRDYLLGELDSIRDDAHSTLQSSQTAHRAISLVFDLIAFGALAIAGIRLLASRLSLATEFTSAVASRDSQIDSLRKHRALLVTAMGSVGDGLIAADTSGRITFMNPIAERSTGWQEQDALGRELLKVLTTVNEKTHDKVELPVAQVLRNNVEREIPTNLMVTTRSGAWHPIAGHVVPIWDDANTAIGVAVVFRDISERKGAREAVRTSEAHKEAVIENALDAVIMANHEGIVIEFNAAAEETFGYKRSEALGQTVAELIVPPALRAKHTAGFRRFLESHNPHMIGKRVELIGMRKGGEEFPIEVAITEVPNLSPPVFCTFLRDITERKKAEAALVAAKEAAENESRDKSVFLNNVSDELRTPLNAVIGYSEMLQEEINERRPQEFIPDLKKINEAGRHLLMLVNDMLDLARIEAGKMELHVESFDLNDLVDDVALAATFMAEKNSNQLRIVRGEKLGTMQSDRLKLRQSVLYLVNNACKFANERDLELEVTRNGSRIHIRVSDMSAGIPTESANQLAEAFASGNSYSSLRFGGHGLGLVIAKHLCEMMGGTLVGRRVVGYSPAYSIELPDKYSKPSN